MKRFCKAALILLLAGSAWSQTAATGQEIRVLDFEAAFKVAKESSPSLQHRFYSLERSEASLMAAQARLKSRFSLNITPFEYANYRQFDDFSATWYTQLNKASYGSFKIEQPLKWTDGLLSLTNRLQWKESENSSLDTFSKTWSNDLFLSLSQPIFTYNRRQMELRQLELDLEKNQINYTLSLLAMEKEVMLQFFNVFQNKERLKISREELASQETSYTIMRNKVDAGLGKLDDLYQTEVNLASARSNLQNQEVTLANSLDQLKQLLGINLYEQIAVDEDVTYRFVPVDLEQAVAHGLEHRLELRQRIIDQALAQDDITRTGAYNEFYGNIRLAYGTTGTSEAFRDMYQSPDKNRQFSISFEIPLWDWGAKDQEMRATQAAFASSQLSYDDERDAIIIAIREAYRSLGNQIAQIDIARQNVRNSQLTFDINLEKFENGDLTAKDLEYYQTQLSQNKLAEVSALIKYRLALLDMKIQSLWDFENDRSVVTGWQNKE